MNRLADESSLYLRQHAENPVDWYPWGNEAFARARAEDRPVLLSIGYSSCHWCHVMAHESFEDPAVAAVMNELFVNVKVDREERPDVDALYMQATVALSGSGGWPMTVFLTPDGRPFFAGTYFPRTPRGGMPGFPDLLRAVSDTYLTRRRDVHAQAEEVASRLRAAAERTSSGGRFTPGFVEDALVGLARAFDPVNGGFGGAPKFPPSTALEFLLQHARRHPDRVNARRMAELTLARMADGGMHDQVGGGFHRYSTDAHWLVPHFEKMLYDNALLARVYLQAHHLTGAPGWRRVAEATLDYLLREMRVEGGAFASAQDADSPGGEGAFFTWTPDELAALLTPDELRAVTLRYGVSAEGNFEGRTILSVVTPLEAVAREIGTDPSPLLASARATLYAARSGRPAPARDDKVIAGWNGLAIAALADSGALLGRADHLEAAREAADFVLARMVVEGRLRRTWQDGRARHLGQLDDHAHMAHGLLQLYAATWEPRWLRAARTLADDLLRLFGDDAGAGFHLAPADGEALVARTRDVEDHPAPSGNAQAASVLLRLAALTGDTALEDRAAAAIGTVRDEVAAYPHAFATALTVADLLAGERREVAIVGPMGDPATRALVETARREGGPGTTIAAGDPSDPAAADAAPLLRDRPPVDGRPAAYVCRAATCRAPVTDPEALARELAGTA